MLDDSASRSRGLGIDRERVLGFEMRVAFDSQVEAYSDRGDLLENEVGGFGEAAPVV